ncbi:MAG: hypothetical protein H0U72_13675 [Nitrosospira sp.]|nr:hypothetical protein [Nitrosospira sp.]
MDLAAKAVSVIKRRAHKAPDPNIKGEETLAEDLTRFCGHGAWILLGEPGAGKSTAFEAEAKTSNGIYMRVAEFLNSDLNENWESNILFLDGLDEARASGEGDSTIELICRQLKRLKLPKFRVACRAADWYGSIDRDDLRKVSPDGQIEILLLEPLNTEEVLLLLRENFDVDQPHLFVQQAIKFGVSELLNNPQTLGLLAQAIHGGRWPATRSDTYKLACEKLAKEENKRHRKKRKIPVASEQILDAAGQLCSVLLFSDKTGIALDFAATNERFPDLTHFSASISKMAEQAIASQLFRPEDEERIVPSHRSVAEYLAARWLAGCIDNNGLPLGRVLNLLTGPDGCAVAGLRGLYGWLALHCQAARTRLIEADPLTVVLYGDVKPMPVADKRRILVGLRREAAFFYAFHEELNAVPPFGALADPELIEDFLAILNLPERDDVCQSHANCVIDILSEGGAHPALATSLLSIVHDDTRWPRIRNSALAVWIILVEDPPMKLSLLEELDAGTCSNQSDELVGTLLTHLYPAHLDLETLLRYLHIPKYPQNVGKYLWFWTVKLIQAVSREHLPMLLDRLVGRPEFQSNDPYEFRLNPMADLLLASALTRLDQEITDAQLFEWLGLGSDTYGKIHRGEKNHRAISHWLSLRPERYKAVLARCFNKCEQDENQLYCIRIQKNRLHDAAPPDDLALWHLEQASRTINEGLAKIHLSEAGDLVSNQRGAVGLTFTQLEEWGFANAARQDWLTTLLICEIPEWRAAEAGRKIASKRNSIEAKQLRTNSITHWLVRPKNSRNDLFLHDLASIWMNRFSYISGETVLERFNNFCENGHEVLVAAETEFQGSLEYSELPTVEEIIDFYIDEKEHFIRLPCLIGMELRWRKEPKDVERFSEATLRRMIAFHLTSLADNTTAWFIYLVQQRSELVADVLIAGACASWSTGKNFLNNIFPLDYDLRYKALTITAVPRLLACFPLCSRSEQLGNLEQLLKAAVRYDLPDLQFLFREKIAIENLDVPQRVYWYAAATLYDPLNYEDALWLHVGDSQILASYLSDFMINRGGESDSEYQLSARTLGNLIEVIGPYAEIEFIRGAGFMTDPMRYGDLVRFFITRLGAMATSEADHAIERLLGMPTLKKLKFLLESARYQLKLRRREKDFHFLPPKQVAQVLANEEPATVADLASLTLDYLDDIAVDIRQDNDDGFRAFWNVERKKPVGQRDENLCRDALLTRLRARLSRTGIDCQPEGDYVNDKRADLRVSFCNKLELPIEIKRDSNASLWTSLRDQLIKLYAIAPAAGGYGIYLVLWFGGEDMPHVADGNKPHSPEELKNCLEAQLEPMERSRVFVRVLDVCWPQ